MGRVAGALGGSRRHRYASASTFGSSTHWIKVEDTLLRLGCGPVGLLGSLLGRSGEKGNRLQAEFDPRHEKFKQWSLQFSKHPYSYPNLKLHV